MTGSTTTDDCLARLDEAFARRKAVRMLGEEAVPRPATCNDEWLARQGGDVCEALDESKSSGATAALASERSTAPESYPHSVTGASWEFANVADTLWRHSSGTSTSLERLVDTIQNLLLIERAISTGATALADRIGHDAAGDVFTEAQQVCDEFDLTSAKVRAGFVIAAYESDRTEVLALEVSELVRHMRHDLRSCRIWPIGNSRVWSMTLALSDCAATAFPSSVSDLAQGGRCLAFASYDASVFHMLRAAAPALRVICRVSSTRTVDRTTAPDWGHALSLVRARVHDAQQWRCGKPKETAIAFWSSIIGLAHLLQDAERKLNTATAVFEEHQASQVCHATCDLLTLLAGRVSEAQGRRLRKKDFE